MATSYAEANGCSALFIGAHSEDYSGYPDCRSEFFDAFQQVIEIGMKPETNISRSTWDSPVKWYDGFVNCELFLFATSNGAMTVIKVKPLFHMDGCMPESSTPFFDYYPPGWEEEVLDPDHIEWIYSGDETIKVRLQVDEEPPTYYVSAISGVNRNGEEYITNSIMNLCTSQAFEVAQLLIYAMNGAIGRIQDGEEFRGDN